MVILPYYNTYYVFGRTITNLYKKEQEKNMARELRSPTPPGGPEIDHAKEFEDSLNTVMNKLITNFNKTIGSLRVSMQEYLDTLSAADKQKDENKVKVARFQACIDNANMLEQQTLPELKNLLIKANKAIWKKVNTPPAPPSGGGGGAGTGGGAGGA